MNRAPTTIAGLCVLESLDLGLQVAEKLARTCEDLGFDYYFKASFDKANRSHKDSFRGPGLERGLEGLQKIKEKLGVKLYTDFHLPSQADSVASVVDFLQIPAFLSRQTDMIEAGDEAAAKYHRKLSVKKGQFLAPQDTANIKSKITHLTPENVAIIERGSSFGYGHLVVDFTGFSEMKKHFQNVIFDCTHSVQRPSQGKVTGGAPEHIPLLMRSAIMSGATGLFIETHPDPKNALSDGANALALVESDAFLKGARACFDLAKKLNV